MKKLFLTIFSAVLSFTNINADDNNSIKNVYVTAPAQIKVVYGEKYNMQVRNSDYDANEYYNIDIKGDTLFITLKQEGVDLPSVIKVRLTVPVCPEFITNSNYYIASTDSFKKEDDADGKE